MTQRLKNKLVWLLLPLFALRGLLPAGFMLDASSGSLSMVICSGGVYKSVQVDSHGQLVASSASATDQGDADQRHKGHEAASQCPFAVASGVAPVAAVVSMVVGVATVVDVVTDDIAEANVPFGPARTQQSRAPPYFS